MTAIATEDIKSLNRSANPLALVTGGSVRIGAQISRQFLQQGWDVVVHSRHINKAQLFCDKLNRETVTKGIAAPCAFSLVESGQSHPAEPAALSGLLKVNALVHNASIFYSTSLSSVRPDDWHTIMDSNVGGALWLTQLLLPALQTANGAIVSVLDAQLEQPHPEHLIYNMAKAAAAQMVKSLAKDLAPRVRVNGVAPGAILWPVDTVNGYTTEQQQKILNSIPLKRTGTPTDIAEAVYFLANASFITGQILIVDGGQTLTIGGE